MTDLVNLSDFSYTGGLNLGDNTKSMAYLYGLSDFWYYIFQDTETTNLLLETTSVQASDIYSKFLQLCCGLSIEDIASSSSSQLILEIINTGSGVGITSNILSGVWTGGFSTLTLESVEGLSTGDIISITGVVDLIIYDLGAGINIDAINEGGVTSTISGVNWNGTFSITNVDTINNRITYYQPVNPGVYTDSGQVTLSSIGIETYSLSNRITSSRFIANRPFLPTVTLEEEVDYHIDPLAGRISFAKRLSEYGFPSRITSNGSIEYSLWFVDVRYDESLIYSSFPILLGRQAAQSTSEKYRSFLYGLFFIYTSGPTLSVMEKGLNLVLGIPLSRDNEKVLEIRKYLSTGQSVVITDYNSYIIPEGLIPTVGVGDSINVGDELSKWVEIIDTQKMPSWWDTYYVEIPPSILPDIPPGGYTRLVSGNSSYYTNWLMRTYLGANTFLVKVNTSYTNFISQQEFESIPGIISELKPSYTGAIYYYYSVVPLTPVYTRATSGTLGESGILVEIPAITAAIVQNDLQTGHKIMGVVSNSTAGNTQIHISTDVTPTMSNASAGDISICATIVGSTATSSVSYLMPVNNSAEIYSVADTSVGTNGVS